MSKNTIEAYLRDVYKLVSFLEVACIEVATDKINKKTQMFLDGKR